MEIGKAVKARNHAPLSFSISIFFFAPYVRDISTRHYVVGDSTRGSFSAKVANGHSVLVAQMRWPSQLPLRKHGHEGDCALGCSVGSYTLAMAADVIIAPHCLELGVQPEQRIKLRCPLLPLLAPSAMYRVVSSYAAPPVIIPGALAILTAASSPSARSILTRSAWQPVGGVGSCLRCVSSARWPTDFFAKYRRSAGACPFLVGILAARFRRLITIRYKKYVR